MDGYSVIRPLLFSLPPEAAHRLVTHLFPLAVPIMQRLCRYSHPMLESTVAGVHFKNPIGLAAGFDKNAELAAVLPAFGFGFIELGTVTGKAQPGNPEPRLFRLPKDRALINRMGFNNIGAAAFKQRLEALSQKGLDVVYGVNIGKSKATPLDQAAAEYETLARLLSPLAAYLAVNVSSPNTPGLRALQGKEELRLLLGAVNYGNTGKKPVFVKISPDLSDAELDAILDVAMSGLASGVIATNTTLSRQGLSAGSHVTETGGLSGAPLKRRSTEVIRAIYKRSQGRLAIIGVGGIETAADAYEKIRAGASLVQVYTGFIYRGPLMVQAINKGLVQLLRRDGLKTIKEAVGKKTLFFK